MAQASMVAKVELTKLVCMNLSVRLRVSEWGLERKEGRTSQENCNRISSDKREKTNTQDEVYY